MRSLPFVAGNGGALKRIAAGADQQRVLIGLATLAALLTVPLFGGRITALADVHVKAVWLALVGIGMQILIINVIPDGAGAMHRAVHLASYGVIAAFVIVNLEIPFLWLIALGGVCNFAAIAANDGVMPASRSALAAAGMQEAPSDFINSAAVPDAHLQFLGDVFATPSWLPVQNVYSIGDVLIVIGALLAVHSICDSQAARWVRARRARRDGGEASRPPVPSDQPA